MSVVTDIPAVAADLEFAPSAKLAIGCSSRKVSICGVEFSRSGQSTCQCCGVKIPNKVVRFIYWHTRGAPAGFIHTECIVRVPLPGAEPTENLSRLGPTEPSLKQALLEAVAAAEARVH